MAHVASRSAWTEKEDELLRIAVHKYGDRAWAMVSSQVPNRSSKSCSDRWRNFLSPNIAHPRKNPFTDWEVAVVVRGQQRFGNNWKAISMLLPGRTNRAVKNLFVGNLKCGARLAFNKNRYLGTGAELEDLIGEVPEGLKERALSAAAASDDDGDASGATSDDSGGSAWLNDDIEGPEATCASVLGARCRSPVVVKVEGGGGAVAGSSSSPEPSTTSHKRRRGNSPAATSSATPPGSPTSSSSSRQGGGGPPLPRALPGPSRLGRVSRRSSNSGTTAAVRYHPYGHRGDTPPLVPGILGAAAAGGGGPRIKVEAAAGMRPSSASDCFTFQEGSQSPVKRVVSPFEAAAHLAAPSDTRVTRLPGEGGLGGRGGTSSSSGGRWRVVLTHPDGQGEGQPSQTVVDPDELRGAPSWTLAFQPSLGGSFTSPAAAAAAAGADSNAASSMGSLHVGNSLTLDGLEALDEAIRGTTVTLTGERDPLVTLMEHTTPVNLPAVPSLEGLPSVPSLLTELGLVAAEPRLTAAEGPESPADLRHPQPTTPTTPAAAAAAAAGSDGLPWCNPGAGSTSPSGNRRRRPVATPPTTTMRAKAGLSSGIAGRLGAGSKPCKACGAATAEAAALRQQVAWLQAEVTALQQDNTHLRVQLAAVAPPSPAAAAAVKTEPQTAPEEPLHLASLTVPVTDAATTAAAAAAAAATAVLSMQPEMARGEETPPLPAAGAAAGTATAEEVAPAAAAAHEEAAAAAAAAAASSATAPVEGPGPTPAAGGGEPAAAAAADPMGAAVWGWQVGFGGPSLAQQEVGPAAAAASEPAASLHHHHHHHQQQQQQVVESFILAGSSSCVTGARQPRLHPPSPSCVWGPLLPSLPHMFPTQLEASHALPAPNRGAAAGRPPPLLAPPGSCLQPPPTTTAAGVPLYPRVAAGGPLPSDIPPALLARVMAARSALQQQQQ